MPTYRPFIFEPNQYEIILCIDTRERIQTSMGTDNRSAFASALQKQDVKVEIRQLPLGDFIWIAREKRQLANMIRFESISTDMNNGYHHSTRSDSIRKELVLDHIIERKRIDDLACSIKDRRWDEQKYRLKNCGLRRPSYLIEYIGSRSKKVDHAGLSYTTLDQAIVNCQIDGFDVKITDNFEETVRYLTFMTRWLERQYTDRMLMSCANKSDLARAGPSDYRYITFNEFAINAGKIHTFTNKEMFVKHLLQIKGLSLAKIDAIVERYPTLCRLLAAYESQSTEKAKQNLLTDLRMNTAINANRRLGPMISKKVSDFYNAV
ncbi:Crossover junction endonuclease mus81 [Blomia tropicalis]|nr:Crossover junction endonuclease mus81 [Blomia tropicalis]